MAEHPSDHPTELIERVRAAHADRTPLQITGGRTKAFVGPSLSGECLSTTGYAGILSHEPTELVITARAGTPLAELEAALAAHGQCLPFEPPHFGAGATVGGMVAAGLAGPARASVGGVRDYVLGVRLINGRGELLTFGGQVMKNVAGYDVSRAIAGSWGTLALLAEVSLKVLPVAPAEATLVFDLDQHEALEQLHRWGGQPLPLNASCWIKDRSVPEAPERLYVRLRGAVAAVDAACERMGREAGGQRIDETQARADWAACRELRLPFFEPPSPEHGLWRLTVPQTAPVLPLARECLVEWHGGQRWLWAPAAAASEIRRVAAEAGGHAMLFKAPADGAPGVSRFDAPAPAVAAISQRLREAFDPAGIFNPGRMG